LIKSQLLSYKVGNTVFYQRKKYSYFKVELEFYKINKINIYYNKKIYL